jgi:hypothetical protein
VRRRCAQQQSSLASSRGHNRPLIRACQRRSVKIERLTCEAKVAENIPLAIDRLSKLLVGLRSKLSTDEFLMQDFANFSRQLIERVWL